MGHILSSFLRNKSAFPPSAGSTVNPHCKPERETACRLSRAMFLLYAQIDFLLIAPENVTVLHSPKHFSFGFTFSFSKEKVN